LKSDLPSAADDCITLDNRLNRKASLLNLKTLNVILLQMRKISATATWMCSFIF